jgi:hypothetical protein
MVLNYIGLLTISLVSFFIGTLLFQKYSKQKNQFTLIMALFFVLAGIGWFIWFLSTDLILGVFNEITEILVLMGLIPQVILLVFVMAFYEVSLLIRTLTIISVILLTLLHIIFPTYRILTIVSSVIIVLNIVLFILNWKRNKDIKSLGFSIGLICIFLGEALIRASEIVQGIFLIIAAVVWLVTYTDLLEKLTSKF